MPLSPEFLELLCCPKTHVPLKNISAAQLEQINAAIKNERIIAVSGKQIAQPLQDGLMTEDHQTMYPIEENIPILLEEMGIVVSQFKGLT